MPVGRRMIAELELERGREPTVAAHMRYLLRIPVNVIADRHCRLDTSRRGAPHHQHEEGE